MKKHTHTQAESRERHRKRNRREAFKNWTLCNESDKQFLRFQFVYTWMFIEEKGNLKHVIDNMAPVYPICLAFTVLEF